MERKILIFLLSICICLGFASCKCLDIPVNAKRIGSGYIQYSHGIYFVELNSVRYHLEKIYTNNSSNHIDMIDPVEGMNVTGFTIYKNNKVEFITGNIAEEYLEKYFSSNVTFVVFLTLILLYLNIIFYIKEGKHKICHIKTDK